MKETSSMMFAYLDETILPLQNRINDLNAIHDYIKFDDHMMKKYGSSIGERFGIVNVHTKIIDGIVIHLDDVISGKYDAYPTESIGALIFYWDKEMYISLTEIEIVVSELESYMAYFQEIEETEETIEVSQKPTIH